MSSWIKIVDGAIVKYSDGPAGLSTADGWREVPYPALQWKLSAVGSVIKKSLADLAAKEQLRVDGKAEDRLRVFTKMRAAVSAAAPTGNPDPLAKFLTKIVLRDRDLEDGL